MRKRIGIFVIIAIFVISVIGCSPSSPVDETTTTGEGTSDLDETTVSDETSAPDETTELRSDATLAIAAAQDWIRDYDRKVADDFTAETGIQVDFQLNPNDQYANIVKAKLASGDGVDIFYSNPGLSLVEYNPDRYAYDLSDQEWVNRYTDWAILSATYDGKVVFCSTGSLDGWGILYNGNLLEEYDLQPATNFDELVEIGETYLENGITPIFEPGGEVWHGCVWLLETGDWLNRKYDNFYESLRGPEGKFADYPETIAFTEELNMLVEKGFFGEEEEWLSYAWSDRSQKMASGEFGMMVAHMAAAAEIHQLYPEVNADRWPLTIIPLAGNNTFSNSGGSMGRVLNKESNYINEGLAYFEFITRVENVQYLYDEGTSPNSTFTDVVLRENYQYETLMASANNVTGPDYTTQIPFYNADNIGRAYVEMWIGDKNPEEVIEQVDRDRIEMFGIIE